MTFRFERQLGARRATRQGFTLIELLVVIAIIGILAAVVLVSLNSARIRGRDARRLSDLQAVSLALEVYNDQNNGLYPTTTTGTAPTNAQWAEMAAVLDTSNLLPGTPVDPQNSGANVYYAQVNAARTSYVIGAQLEQDNQACDADYDGTDVDGAGTACDDGGTNDCGAADPTATSPDYCVCQGPACT